MALEEEIRVPEPDKIPRNDIDIENPPKFVPERALKRAQPSEKKNGGGGEVDASTG